MDWWDPIGKSVQIQEVLSELLETTQNLIKIETIFGLTSQSKLKDSQTNRGDTI